jgi:CRISPR-associated endonuclease/helicase Cas3
VPCYAHSLPGKPHGEWQLLEVHLAAVAALAERFASSFAPGWGSLAGLWHDAGKYQAAFQRYIATDSDAHIKGPDHATVGALIARAQKAPALAFAIAGHHGGLPDAEDLKCRLERKQPLLDESRTGGLPRWVEEATVPALPACLNTSNPLQFSLWTRLLFSALVDADFLDTEKFYAGGSERGSNWPSLTDLKTRLDEFLDRKTQEAHRTPVNEMRARVLAACRRAATFEPGAFTLTVPTGGGKTFSSLAFALDHAVQHGLERVIVVIPYTSIIEQTAQQYRSALGEDAVLEHHTNVDPDDETPQNRLASENWDAPVVVTTSVQFFESLYANRTSRCRKLHRIVRSVVVFDEVQTFPVHLLEAVRRVLRELTTTYGSTALLCTATKPELLEGAREIVPDPAQEFAVVARRSKILMPKSDEPIAWEDLASELRSYEQVMAIVHRREDAQRLAQLAGGDCLHLSARMCAEHRSDVLAEVRRRLDAGERCRLVATQLVEAGVDVDFPEVFRAFAGADSLAQAAGRCNREGRARGRLHVFNAPTKPPAGVLRTGLQIAQLMEAEGRLDLKSPETFGRYFARLYGVSEQDARAVLAAERVQKFKTVAELFRMIEESGESVVAPYGDDWVRRLNAIRYGGVTRLGMRRLQRFMVNLYEKEITALRNEGALERIADLFWAVVPGFKIYDNRWGFGWQGDPKIEPEYLIA